MTVLCRSLPATALLVTTFAAATDTASTNAPPAGLLLPTPMGKTLDVSTNEVPAGLLPPGQEGLRNQMPEGARGLPLPAPVRQRLDAAPAGAGGWEWFPAAQPRVMPYLAAQDLYGNTAIKPGPLLPASPLDVWPQQAKYAAAEAGLRYSLKQTLNWISLTDTRQGDNTLGYYTFSFSSKWAVFSSAGGESAGWLSSEVKYQTGLGWSGNTQNPRGNLGSATNPSGTISSHEGVRIGELAWQQSLADGRWVILAGMVDQSNYVDCNSYANSARGQFMNSALVNSMIVPMPAYNFGLNLQWQPVDEFYAVLGPSVGNGRAGVLPWVGFAWNNWSLTSEFGWAPSDLFGLGPGVYRFQPFVGQQGGAPAQVGWGLNFQQQLGHAARFGWFGRLGRGGRQPFIGDLHGTEAAMQVGTGFVAKGPLEYLGLIPSRRQDAAGLAFVWSQPRSQTAGLQHTDEYALEAGYVLQLTPTAKLQPDLQVIWNPAFNPNPGPALVAQLQLLLSW